jgi:hypothetical protein
MPGGFFSVSANGNDPTSAILWTTRPLDGDASASIVHGVLQAFAANDVTRKLWQSDQPYLYGKNCAPTVANGKVYLGTFSQEVIVFGLKDATQPPRTTLLGEATPARPSTCDVDRNAVELGVKFDSQVDGMIGAVRFYRGADNPDGYAVHLWQADGTRLATSIVPAGTAPTVGWKEGRLVPPLPIRAGTTYVASYFTSNGCYAFEPGGLANPIRVGSLTAPASGVSGGNGVFAYGATSRFPSSSYQKSNYWVDVGFALGCPAGSAGPGQLETIFGDALPEHPTSGDTVPVTLGVQFRSSQDGYVFGVRFYRAKSNVNGYVARIWDQKGTALGTAAAPADTTAVPGWREARFAAPVPVRANDIYVASYFTSNGGYAYDVGGLRNGQARGPLTALAGPWSAALGNGVFSYAGTPLFPDRPSSVNANYWVDVEFSGRCNP